MLCAVTRMQNTICRLEEELKKYKETYGEL